MSSNLAQPYLFDESEMPRTERPAVDVAAELPESLRTLLEVGYPGEALEALIDHYGGQLLYPPKTVDAGHPLAERLGLEAARVLALHYGGTRFDVPKAHAQKLALRNAAIRWAYDQGIPVSELVRRHGLTDRRIRQVLGVA